MDRADLWPRAARFVLLGQGWLYVVTGLWPVVHLGSFELITGEKYDDFLVHTVGLLLFVVGTVLLLAVHRNRLSAEVVAMAAGTALTLCLIDVVYFGNGRLPPIYLLDAVVEFIFCLVGLASLLLQQRGRREPC
ncbi:MAG TPA: hypothetical protein VFI92_13040 [Steroidobacteraceae bacterium]|nr:hypothetical protein [Steroidobacteraceae bacterium]